MRKKLTFADQNRKMQSFTNYPGRWGASAASVRKSDKKTPSQNTLKNEIQRCAIKTVAKQFDGKMIIPEC